METLKIEIIDPKAFQLIKKMQTSHLIRISEEPISKLKAYLKRTRKYSDSSPGPEKISQLVEEARAERYKKNNP